MIFWYSTKKHYTDHIQHHLQLAPDLATYRLDRPGDRRHNPDAPVLVAGRSDARALYPRRTILIEHGVGQSYLIGDTLDRIDAGNAPPDRNVIEHWVPNTIAAEPMELTLPNADTVHAGAPHLYALAQARDAATKVRDAAARPTIAVAVHWQSPINAPEARGAWPWLSQPLADLLRSDLDANIVICPHPRLGGSIRRHRLTRDPRVVVEPDWTVALAASDILIADNTSMLWEAAALNLLIIGVWPPHWRPPKTVPQHGLRFPGPHHIPLPVDIETSDELHDAVYAAIHVIRNGGRTHPPRNLQRRVIGSLYPTVAHTAALTLRHLQRVDAIS